jgi:hypothetical protein
LETPIDKPGDDRRNVAALWKLVGRVVKATGNGMNPRRKKSNQTSRVVKRRKIVKRSTGKAVTKRRRSGRK